MLTRGPHAVPQLPIDRPFSSHFTLLIDTRSYANFFFPALFSLSLASLCSSPDNNSSTTQQASVEGTRGAPEKDGGRGTLEQERSHGPGHEDEVRRPWQERGSVSGTCCCVRVAVREQAERERGMRSDRHPRFAIIRS